MQLCHLPACSRCPPRSMQARPPPPPHPPNPFRMCCALPQPPFLLACGSLAAPQGAPYQLQVSTAPVLQPSSESIVALAYLFPPKSFKTLIYISRDGRGIERWMLGLGCMRLDWVFRKQSCCWLYSESKAHRCKPLAGPHVVLLPAVPTAPGAPALTPAAAVAPATVAPQLSPPRPPPPLPPPG